MQVFGMAALPPVCTNKISSAHLAGHIAEHRVYTGGGDESLIPLRRVLAALAVPLVAVHLHPEKPLASGLGCKSPILSHFSAPM